MVSFIAKKSQDSQRLDVVLSGHSRISSRSEAQRLIKTGGVSVNNSHSKISPSLIIRKGDIISFILPRPPSTDITPVPYNLEIVYEDDYLIVVNKARGIVVHPAAGHSTDTLVNYLLHHTNLSGIDPTRPGIVHRIDKDTSGLLVVAKDNHSHENLTKQFFDHSVERKYRALVWGIPQNQNGIINQPIARHPIKRKKFAVRPGGKSAITHWEVIESYHHLSLLECRLETGRTHQIRVHLSSFGHSLLGDPVYGRFRNYAKNYPDSVRAALRRFSGQALHAQTLGFAHPHLGERMAFEAPLPEDLQSIISLLKEDFKQ